jgi:glutaredoxin-like YruB-family protein
MPAGEIKVYFTPTCPYCKMIKKFLTQNNISFQELDVALDKTAREEMIRKSGQMGVPVNEINGEVIIGYNEARLKEKLGL